jgi:spore coat-associated protein N
MNRITALWRTSPGALLLGLGTIGLAAALTIGSGADFTSTTANPSNIFTAGTFAHTNSNDGAAIFTGSNMRPGDTAFGTVDIKNTGSLSGAFTLASTVTADTTAPANPFASKLTVAIVDQTNPTCTGTCPGTTVYSGPIAGMGTVALGTFAAGVTHRYAFTVTFTDGGPGADNAYRGASTTVTYTWTATS